MFQKKTAALVATAMALTLAACGNGILQPSKEQVQEIQNNIRYIRDDRVPGGLCFAYFYEMQGLGNAATGGPALAGPVDCEKVKLLLNDSGQPPEHPEKK